MVNDNNLERNIDFVARQLVYLSEEKKLSTEDALKLIGSEASDEVNAAIAFFEGILSGDKLDLGKASPFYTFTDSICERDASPRAVGLLLTKFIKLHNEYSQVVRSYILSLKNTLAYSGALILIACIISLIYNAYVLSGINTFFAEYGGDLPAFTAYMMSGGMYVVYGLLVIGAIYTISFSVMIRDALKKSGSFKPVSSQIARLYVLRGITMSVNRYLFLNYIYLFLSDDSCDERAIDRAIELATDRSPKVTSSMFDSGFIDELRMVSKLGTLGNEIKYLLDNASDELQHQIVNFRSKVTIGFQIMIFLIIGALVVAYYLPLFYLGSML